MRVLSYCCLPQQPWPQGVLQVAPPEGGTLETAGREAGGQADKRTEDTAAANER